MKLLFKELRRRGYTIKLKIGYLEKAVKRYDGFNE